MRGSALTDAGRARPRGWTGPTTGNEPHYRLRLLGIVLGAFALRLLPWSKVFRPEGVVFYDPDSYYHMRRVFLILADFPRFPLDDTWQNFPFGGATIWPPLFELPLAAVAWALGLGRPSDRLVEVLGAFYPPVLGALGVLATWSLGRALGGRRVGLLAALFLALLPAHILYSALGHPDQHVSEVLCSVAFFASLTRSMRPRARAGPRGPWGEANLGAALAAGLWLAASLFVWNGSALFPVVGAAFAALRLVAAAALREDPRPIFAGSTLAFVSGSVLATGASWVWLGRGQTEASYVTFTWFLSAVCLIAAAGVFVLGLAVVLLLDRRVARSGVPVAAILALLAAALVHPPGTISDSARYALLSFRHILKQSEATATRSGGQILTYDKTYLRTTQEYQPLLRHRGGFSTFHADRYLTRLWWAVPPAGAWLFWRSLKRRGTAAERWEPSREAGLFFLPWAGVMGWMALNQVKYVYFAAPIVAVTGAMLIEAARARATEVKPAARRAGLVAAASLLAWAAYPSLRYLARFVDLYEDLDPTIRATLWEMRRFTPEAGRWTDVSRVPSYGVLTFWDLGNYALYIARRPVIASSNGYAYRTSFDFLLAEDESRAAAILEERKCRYVVVNADLPMGLVTYLLDSEGGASVPEIAARLDESSPLSTRLLFRDGTGPVPATRFRLIYESRPAPKGLASVKVFEFVRGARIHGRAEPGARIEAELPVRTNRGRRFFYRASATAGADGSFELALPYATRDGSSPTRAAGPLAVLSSDGRRWSAEVPDDAVTAGLNVVLPALHP